MKKNLLIVLLFLCITSVFSQSNLNNEIKNTNPNPNGDPWIVGGLKDLTDQEWIEIQKTPKLILKYKPVGFLNKMVLKLKTEVLGAKDPIGPLGGPSRIDNSLSKAFRPIFSQIGNCCAQASGVGYNFTYEINLLNGTDASKERNCFPSHYTWSILNSGVDNGSWYYDGWELIKENGCPKIPSFGSMASGGDLSFWMSGQEKYQKAMSNRILATKTIDLKTWQGINTLRAWLHDKGRGEAIGGLANFGAYASNYASSKISSGQYKGENLITAWGPTGGHAMTIVGYDDSISFDYNGDGVYTTDVDINGDGIINLKDSEVGAFIFANSWGTWWGDQGFSYMMYKLCAEEKLDGGLMARSMVHVLDNVSDIVKPTKRLDFKMEFSNRGQMMVGLAYNTDVNATDADLYNTHFFNTLNKKGGNHSLRGTNDFSDLPMEMSLDVSKLNEWFPNYNGGGKFFFVVNNYLGQGKLHNVTYIDIENNLKYQADIINATISRGKYFVPINIFAANHVRLIPKNIIAKETIANDGTINDIISFTIKDADFKTEKPIVDVDYQIFNLPLGMTAEIEIFERNILKVRLLGNAIDNEKANDVAVKIIFNDSMFRDLKSADLEAYKQEINFDIIFKDRYSTLYFDMKDTPVVLNEIWNSVREKLEFTYGLELEQKAYVLCDQNTSNISLLVQKDIIDVSKHWVDFNNVGTIDNFSVDEKYIGIKFTDIYNNAHYAWLLCQKGEEENIIISEFAYFTRQDNPILAGRPSEASIKIESRVFTENKETNSGIVTQTILCELFNADLSISKSATLNKIDHYSHTKLPLGMFLSITVVERNIMEIKIKGRAENHDNSNSANFTLSFKDKLFQSENARSVSNGSFDLEIKFRDPYKIIYSPSSFESFTCSNTNSWKTFRLVSPDGTTLDSYVGFSYYTDNVSVQSNQFEIVTKPGSQNISVFELGEKISANSDQWFVMDRQTYPYLYNPNYTDWKGRDAYMAFTVLINEQKHFGWMHLKFSDINTSVEIINWAYNEQTNAPIIAGKGAFKQNFAPVADAGENQIVNDADVVVLNANNSYDINQNTILEYLWTAPQGISITKNNEAILEFIAPKVSSKTEYVFELMVSDGILSSNDTVIVIVEPGVQAENNPPKANAGVDKEVNEGDLVFLSALASSDPESDPLTYSWTHPGSISLLASTSASPSFVAPMVFTDTEFVFEVSVFDGENKSIDQVIVMVRNIPNNAPIAIAGDNITVVEGEEVFLNASQSSDPDRFAKLTFTWSSETDIIFDNPNRMATRIIAPMVDIDTDFIVNLEVSDGELTAKSSLRLRVTNIKNTPPVAIIEKSIIANEGDLIVLDASKCYDNESEITYIWTSSNNNIKLNNSSQVKASFYAPMVEKDTFIELQLIISDGVHTITSIIDVEIKNVPNNIPVAVVDNDVSVNAGVIFKLDGSRSYDADRGAILTYLWTNEQGVEILNAQQDIASFLTPTLDVDKKYTFKLTVSDKYSSNEASLVVTVVAPKTTVYKNTLVVNTGLNKIVNIGDMVTLDGRKSTGLNTYGVDVISWSSPDGLIIENANSLNANFIAPSVDKDTNYELVLSIENDRFQSSSTLIITVLAARSVRIVDFTSQTQNIIKGGSVSFSNVSENIDDKSTFKWSFVGGLPSTYEGVNPPQIIYTELGKYDVVLTVIDGDNILYTKTRTAYIMVDIVNSLPQIDENRIAIYPNPTSEYVFISKARGADCLIYTANGSFVSKQKIVSDIHEINLSAFSKGVYILFIKSDKLNEKFKLIVM